MADDEEANRLSARAARYLRVGTNVGAVAARVAGSRLFGYELDRDKNAAELAKDGLAASAVTDLEPAVRTADIVTCVTTSTTPIVKG